MIFSLYIEKDNCKKVAINGKNGFIFKIGYYSELSKIIEDNIV